MNTIYDDLNVAIETASVALAEGKEVQSAIADLTKKMHAYLQSEPDRNQLINLAEKIFHLSRENHLLKDLSERIDTHLFPKKLNTFFHWEDKKMLPELQKLIIGYSNIGFPGISKNFEKQLASTLNSNEIFNTERHKHLPNPLAHASRFKFPKVSLGSTDQTGETLLQFVKNAPFLKELSARCLTINSESLVEILKNCHQLEELQLYFPKLNTEGFKELSKLSDLKSLKLSCFYADNLTDYAYLSQLVKLEKLNLSNCSVVGQELESLHLLPNLKILNLLSSRLTSEGLSHIAKISSLEEIELDEISDADLPELAKLKKLKKISLNNCHQITENLNMLASQPNIQSILLYNCNEITNESLNKLSSLPNIQSIFLHNCNRLGSEKLNSEKIKIE